MPAATALLFDMGVFAVVVGATVLILIAIAHQSLRSARLRARDEADAAAVAGQRPVGLTPPDRPAAQPAAAPLATEDR